MWSRRSQTKRRDQVAAAGMRFLRGEAVDLLHESGQGLPTWALLNLLAHTSLGRLRSLAKSDAFHPQNGWNAAVAYLAIELLGVGQRTPDEIALIQRTVLVPLELALLNGDLRAPSTPGEFVTLVIGALGRASVRDRHE
jgi:hypothetical protein